MRVDHRAEIHSAASEDVLATASYLDTRIIGELSRLVSTKQLIDGSTGGNIMQPSKARFALLFLPLLITACGQREVSFQRDISPILQENCVVCHSPGGPGYIKSGFSVATYQDVMKGTRYGRVIIPGSSISSTLVRLINHQADPLINMPKEYTSIEQEHSHIILPGSNARWLSKHDRDLITRWIDQGAKNN